jgi:putative endonuclease
MSTSHQLGRKGEAEAAAFLTKKNYQILEKNYRYRKSEVDLIVQKNNILVAVEIKTRSTTFFGDPAFFLKTKQQHRIVEAIDYYVQQNNLDVEVRFDVISILKKNNALEIQHIENAFYHF